MTPLIIVSTRGGMDVTTFRDVVKAVSYCARMDRFGIAYEMVTY